MKGNLVKGLTKIRFDRLQNERVALFEQRMNDLLPLVRQYYETRPTEELVPQPPDICNLEPFRKLIMTSTADTNLTAESFQPLVSILPQLTAEWSKRNDHFLVNLVPTNQALRKLKVEQTARLHLATTFFRCYWCIEPIGYPRILQHKCLLECHGPPKTKEARADEFLRACGTRGVPWNYGDGQVQFDVEAAVRVRVILDACGMDADVTTASEMDVLEHWFECLCCSGEERGSRLVMSWRNAVRSGVNSAFGTD
jgi:hypothetical protein